MTNPILYKKFSTTRFIFIRHSQMREQIQIDTLGSFFFRMPKTEDHFTGHRFEIEPNSLLHLIGECLVRVLRVVSDMTGNRKYPKNRE